MAKLCLKNLFYFTDFIACCYGKSYQAKEYDESLLTNQKSKNIEIEGKEIKLNDLIEENKALKQELTSRREQQHSDYVPKPLDLSEYKTRKIYIDSMLIDSGWIEGKDWINEVELAGMPNKSEVGYADYVLYDDSHKPLAVIEAKRTCVNVSKGRQQAKLYADLLEKKYKRRPVIFLTNGFETRIDDGQYPERKVSSIYSKRDLEKLFNLRRMQSHLDYIQVNKDIAGRYYQEAAIKAVCDAFDKRNRRKALLVMATGSGKTRTVIGLVDVLLQKGWIKNILFLADRNSLVTQAKRSFNNMLKDLSNTNLVEEKDNYKEVGRDLEESIKAAKYLQDAGYDMLNADNGTYDAWYWAHPPGYMPMNCNLEDCETIKKYVDIPVVCAGKMEMEVGAKAVEEGKIDGVGVARQFLVDGKWITKLMKGEEDDIQPCIRCHNGCFSMASYKGVANDQAFEDVAHMSRCALNPQTMQPKKYDIIPAKKKKNIAIIGGGIGGIEVARIATLRGHHVTIYEKTDKLGGVFIPASNFDFKEEDKKLLRWYNRQIEKLNIDVRYNCEINDISKLSADEIIIATGAKAKKLNIKGSENFIEAVDYLNNKKEVGDKVVIIGGGLTGCEIAYDLHKKGKTPIIVEAKNDLIAVRGVCLANSSYLRDYFKLHNVEIHLESFVKEANENGVIIKTKEGKEITVPCDSVILSIGYNPAPAFKKSRKVHYVGDCSKVGNLRTVVWEAWKVATKL